MTILSIIQDATDELSGVARPTSVVASTEREIQRLLRFAHRTGDRIIQKYEWPSCTLQGTITLVGSQATYALPGDFHRLISNTHWDNSNHWMLIGPYTAQEWQALKRGVSTNIPRKAFRIHTRVDNQIDLHPIPGTSEAGNLLYYEYVSKSWCAPTPWVTSTAFAAGSYCSYNGNFYSTVAGGTTGSTAPTHTTGSASDGGVTWVYVSAAYNRFLADTDTSLIDENIITLGVIWRYLRSIGNEYAEAQAEFDDAVEKAYAGYVGARILDFNKVRNPIMIGPWNIPDTFN